ncbi:MAG: hypothetical protein C0P75_005120 [Bacilli bacterium]|jgi:hypothetical protein|uniref:Uncharacterized protein n=1 Tax=Ureibacillus suwonensis TaxID=313007 RepID=A0ABW0RBF8_9BACL|nr:hypothetical protein [Bacilli bacterium]
MKKYNELLHLPDLQFSQYCEQQFSVNKGIYNTIDQWFYRKGIINILARREKILLFMLYSCSTKEKVKFGPGGLTKALEDFWQHQRFTNKLYTLNT